MRDEIEKDAKWFVEEFNTSAFIDDEEKIDCLINLINKYIIKAKKVERERIEKLIFKYPKLVEENDKIYRTRGIVK